MDEKLSAKLNELILANASIEEMVEFAQEAMGNPVLVTNSNLNLLARYPEKVDDSLWDYLASFNPNTTSDMTLDIERKKPAEKLRKNQRPIINEFPFSKYRMLDSAVVWKDEFLGVMHVLEYNREFESEDSEKLIELSKALALLMAANGIEGNKSLSMEDITIRYLLQGLSVSENLILDSIFRLQKNHNYAIIVCEDADIAYRDTRMLGSTLNALVNKLVHARGIIFDDAIVILAQIPTKGAFFSYDWSNLKPILNDRKLRAAVSDPFTDFREMKQYYRQSIAALMLSRRFSLNETLYHFADIGIYEVFDQAVPYLSSAEKYPPLARLLNYDEEKGTQYFKDLFIYLQNNCNAKLTAEALSVHKNTINYRISRISEITGGDLKDMAFLFRLQFSIKILYYQEASEFSEKYGIPNDQLKWPVI